MDYLFCATILKVEPFDSEYGAFFWLESYEDVVEFCKEYNSLDVYPYKAFACDLSKPRK